MFTSLRDMYRRELITTKSAYFCDKIEESTRNMTSMYRVANALMGRKLPRTLPEHHCSDEVMADRFLEHFTDKITSIRQRLNQPSDAQAARSAIDNERSPCELSTDFKSELCVKVARKAYRGRPPLLHRRKCVARSVPECVSTASEH